MLWGIRFIIASLGAAIFHSGLQRYKNQLIPPTRSNLHEIPMTEDTALYMWIAVCIVVFLFFVILVAMYRHQLQTSGENGAPLLTLLLFLLAIFFGTSPLLSSALGMMLLAETGLYLGIKIGLLCN